MGCYWQFKAILLHGHEAATTVRGMNTSGGERPPRKIRSAAPNDALPVMGLAANEGVKIPKGRVFAWALWDWATQPFATVITTFVFSVYLTSELFLPEEIRALGSGTEYDLGLSVLSRDFGFAVAIAGLAVAILAPVLGQRADRSGRRKRQLAINTALLVAVQASLFFTTIEPNMFVFGITMVAIGNIFSEIANVNYNAMITQVASPTTVGRVSGLGWGFGYLGGITMLLVSYFGFIEFDLFGLGSANGIDIRAIAVACAVWTVVFAIPILLFVPEVQPAKGLPKTNFFASYRILFQDIIHLYRTARTTFWFLLASAIFRDGLSGVFTFGGVLAAITFGFSATEVLIFGIVANLVAGISTMAAGKLDDRFGPRAVILGSLSLLLASGLSLFLLRDAGALAFWIGGLVLGASVGPAQAAARSFLARVTPAGQEGQIFGLYATTGRAVGFLTPTLWSLFIAIGGAQYWGILGIMVVLAVGLVLMVLVKLPSHVR